jgi:hypothetical protein
MDQPSQVSPDAVSTDTADHRNFGCACSKQGRAKKDTLKCDRCVLARKLDQFYTHEAVAEELYDWFCTHFDPNELVFVEPSAGRGAFSRLFPPGSLAYDIDPQGPGIIKADFLSTPLPQVGKVAVVGNPPFGKNASLAVKFFNHAAINKAEVIAMIVPLTFQKVSLQNRLNLEFHCIAEKIVPQNAFIMAGHTKKIPTVFQIWTRCDNPRAKNILPTTHPDFNFTRAESATFAIRRVGDAAGKVHWDFSSSDSSNYFMSANTEGVESVFSSIDFGPVARRTAGNPSLSKTELVDLYVRYKASNDAKAGARR